jgi:transposase InsO family protein
MYYQPTSVTGLSTYMGDTFWHVILLIKNQEVDMPWDNKTPFEQRWFMLQKLFQEKAPVTKIAKEFGVSRKTFYKFKQRFEAEGVTGLQDRSRAPHQRPRKIPQVVEEAIVELRCQHPDFGPVRLQAELKNLGVNPPSHQGIQNVLVRHHLNGWNAPEKREYRRFERSSPNELWQLDTKGFFIIKGWGKAFPLNILDDYSRFCIASQLLPLERSEYILDTLEKAIATYGRPQYLITDNGSWFVHKDKALTRVQMFLKDQGILHILTGVRRPTTIGKVERFHRTLNRELIKKFRFKDLVQAQEACDTFRFYYNYQRPHQALGNLPPISRYKFVKRKFPKPPVPIFYPQGSLLRKVRGNGCISFNGNEIFISYILIGKTVKIEQTQKTWEIYYDKNLIKTVTYVS